MTIPIASTLAPAWRMISTKPLAACPLAKKSSITNTLSEGLKNFPAIETVEVTCFVNEYTSAVKIPSVIVIFLAFLAKIIGTPNASAV